MNDWQKSGKIAREAREYALTLAKVGARHLDIVEAVEKKIVELGGKPAFPMDVSVNHMAAHVTPKVDDTHVLQKGDLVKLDIGTHVNGCVADTAVTVEIGTTQWKELIAASEQALKAAIEQCTPGNQIRSIGRAIHQTITSYGFKAITNLSGHGLGEWIVHDDPTIPNFDNGDTTQLVEGQHIAIEPFATTGIGVVGAGKPCGVYMIQQVKPVRLQSLRAALGYFMTEFNTLPFCARWIKHVPNYQFALRQLEKEGILKQYTDLPEKSGGMVSQAEHTVEIGTGQIT